MHLCVVGELHTLHILDDKGSNRFRASHVGKATIRSRRNLWINGLQYPFDINISSSKLGSSINIIIYHCNISNTMPELQISVEDEQKAFEADVAAIEKQWSSARQSHLKRYVNFASCYENRFTIELS
jgi:hypothetical protein